MRKLILSAALIATAFASTAHADDWNRGGFNHYNGYGHGREYGHREYNGGGNGWVAPAIGGLLIGGMLMNMQQNYQAQQQYQPTCQRVFVGNVVVDGQMVQAFKTVCQ